MDNKFPIKHQAIFTAQSGNKIYCSNKLDGNSGIWAFSWVNQLLHNFIT